ncbi:hypothetical protein B0A52_00906 [Exophiala mesophila]|uniref:C3H1-type domain-containing protein n=1 Tax=Exophiala mesophila TaxID=212818 RepID=A0A438NIK3_EXOME|nr:hypothetical protein B0A52_00906 [Exophiala mesophila]
MAEVRAETSSLKPQFFVTRQNGAMVPLIAMDELPHHIQIRNLSRTLSTWDTAGMTGVGVAPSRHEYYVVDAINNSIPPFARPTQQQEPSVETTALPIRSPQSPARPNTVLRRDVKEHNLESLAEEGRAYGVEDQTASEVDTPISTSSLIDFDIPMDSPSPTETSPTISVGSSAVIVARPHGKKTHCAYWMRKGECDFAQTGCIYKHEMPTDLAGLHAVGLQDLPKWYRERYGKGSLLVGNGHSKLSHGIHDMNWRRGSGPQEVSRASSRQSYTSNRHSTASTPSTNNRGRKAENRTAESSADERVDVEDDKRANIAPDKRELIRRHEEALNAAARKRDQDAFRKGNLMMTGWAHPSLRPVFSRRGRALHLRREVKDGKKDGSAQVAAGSVSSRTTTQGKAGSVDSEAKKAKGTSSGSSK